MTSRCLASIQPLPQMTIVAVGLKHYRPRPAIPAHQLNSPERIISVRERKIGRVPWIQEQWDFRLDRILETEHGIAAVSIVAECYRSVEIQSNDNRLLAANDSHDTSATHTSEGRCKLTRLDRYWSQGVGAPVSCTLPASCIQLLVLGVRSLASAQRYSRDKEGV